MNPRRRRIGRHRRRERRLTQQMADDIRGMWRKAVKAGRVRDETNSGRFQSGGAAEQS